MEDRYFVIRPEDKQQDWRVAKNCQQAIRDAIKICHGVGRPVGIKIVEHRDKRSLAQNRCFHGFMKAIADWWEDASGQRIEPEAWKVWFKRQYLGKKVVEMPDGTQVETLAQTSKLEVDAMKQLLDRIEAWAAEQDGLELPRGEDYQVAMQKEAA